MKTLIDFIKNLKSFYQFYKDYKYNGDECEFIIENYQEVLCNRTRMMSKPTYYAGAVIAEMDRWYENNKPIETSEFHDMTIDIDVSVDAVNEYAKSILGRYPKNNYEFSRALAMKILEEAKSLANNEKKE